MSPCSSGGWGWSLSEARGRGVGTRVANVDSGARMPSEDTQLYRLPSHLPLGKPLPCSVLRRPWEVGMTSRDLRELL